MTIRPDDDARNDAPLKGESAFAPHPSDPTPDLPPSYTPTTPHDPSGSSSTSTPLAPPAPPALPSALLSAPRSSHVSVTSPNSSINSAHVIDLNVVVPPSALPALTEEDEEVAGERVNGFWSSRNGGVKLKLGVKGREGGVQPGKNGERVRIVAKSQNGSVNVAVLSRSPLSLPPISLTLLSANGFTSLSLPRSFRGPIYHSTAHGSIKISSDLKPYYTPISEERGFIGDMDGWDGETGGLDEARCESRNGGVKVGWADEQEEGGDGKGAGGVVGWLFGGGKKKSG